MGLASTDVSCAVVEVDVGLMKLSNDGAKHSGAPRGT